MYLNLFIVESPLQLLSAYEAINYFGIKKYKILIRLSNSKENDNQILKLLKCLKVKDMSYVFSLNAKNKTLLDYLKITFFKMLFFYLNKRVKKLFLGNFESGFMKILMKNINKKKIILLDDGAKSIVIQSKFNNMNNFDFFTFFDLDPLEGQQIYSNSFSMLKNKIKNKEKANFVLFLGTKLSELDIVSEEYYIRCIKEIAIYYIKTKIIYIPHREENKNKLKLLEKNISNLKIKKIDYPVELFGLNESFIPQVVASFYSTALFTMNKIYCCNSNAFKFDYEKSIYKESIDKVYHDYANKIKVLELNSVN
ncbi:alpha-2,8-polysialyltransferase family protein [Arcobacter roscoffensis]|uniref:Alpha-2,8-polysialyltransferase family protein n=1 Tax=Arcobacter roscoffensis TaxID=2961520 RepID=A0ABY5E5B0_9BACT|nr:alpha-2,8-polysialyltransferase family protein [Arcobacter roscoffensis]UTJ07339.1 alpha-2,8-polysialyltransferase family protein [Arcobacter roscoffensis]